MIRKRKSEIEIEFVTGREMTEAEMESVARILFEWWKEDYEVRRTEEDCVQASGRGSWV